MCPGSFFCVNLPALCALDLFSFVIYSDSEGVLQVAVVALLMQHLPTVPDGLEGDASGLFSLHLLLSDHLAVTKDDSLYAQLKLADGAF